MSTLLILFGVSFVLSLLLTPQVRSLARRWGLIDKPDQRRKLHVLAVPIGGGIAILFGSLATLMLLLLSGYCPWVEEFQAEASFWYALATAAVMICCVGLLDDAGCIRGRHKLLGQIVAISILMWSGLIVKSVRVAEWEIDLGLTAIPFTAFFLLGAINSLNLLDGMDGLLSSVGFIVCLAFAGMAVLGDKWTTACVAVTVAGSLLGFLRFNFPPASIYLGDTGSMLIGLVVGALAINSSLKGPAAVALAAPLAVLIVPILDTVAAICRRKLTGRSLFLTDRGHLHHCLLARGFSKVSVLMIVVFFCTITAFGAYLSITLNRQWVALFVAFGVAVFLAGMRWFGHGELSLAVDSLKNLASSMVTIQRDSKPRHSAVRIQGNGPWTEFWAALVKFAEAMSLKTIRLDINVPSLHEGYHGRWEHATPADSNPGSTTWNANIPLVWRDQTVGRLEVSGMRDEQPAWIKIAELTKLVDELEKTLTRIAQEKNLPGEPSIATESQTILDVARSARSMSRLNRRYQRLIDMNLAELKIPAVDKQSLDSAEVPSRSRVLVFNRSYYPDVEATGQLLTELCTDLARERDVHVISGLPNFVTVEGKGLLQKDAHLGVEVTRVRNLRFSKKSLIGRAFGLLTYMILAFWVGLRSRRPDVIIVETDPPFLGLMGVVLRRWHGCSLIYYVQDLYPEVGLALGRLRPGLVTKLLFWATQVGLRGANRVIVLGEDMRSKVLARGIQADKISIVSNWADTELIQPKLSDSWDGPMLAANPFTVMYSGNLGLSQNLENLLEVAKEMRDLSIRFVLIGEGAAKAQLQAQAESWGLTNVSFHPYRPKEQLSESLTSADVHFIPLRRGLAGAIVPSKLYGILAAGVPFIAAVDADSEVARVAETTGAGLVISPDSVSELTNAIQWCLENRSQLPAMGLRGREEAEARFSRPICVQQIDRVIASVAGEDATAAKSPVETRVAAPPPARMEADFVGS